MLWTDFTLHIRCNITVIFLWICFARFLRISLYIPPFCPIDIFASLKHLKVDYRPRASQRTMRFLASVSCIASTAPQVNSELPSQWSLWGEGMQRSHVSNLLRALLSSILPSVLLQWHWFLGRRIGYCWSERPRNLPENVHQCCPLPIFHLFPISRISQWREVRQESGGCVWGISL